MITKLSPKAVKKSNKQFTHEFEIVLVAEHMQYAQNVASLFRIADALKARKIYLTGESHHPPFGKDLQKVSRGKERVVAWEHSIGVVPVLEKLKKEGYTIIAIEQCEESHLFTEVRYPKKLALLVGSEMFGMSKKALSLCDRAVIIPMYGNGGSINVHVALAVVAFYAVSQRKALKQSEAN